MYAVLAAAAEAAPTTTTDLLMQLGVGGIFAYIMVKEVLAFVLKSKGKNGNGSAGNSTADMFVLLRENKKMLQDLHSWHDAKDEDQVFVWYVRKSLERQIEKLCTAVEKIGKANDSQTDAIEDALTAVLAELQALRDELTKLGGPTGG